MMGELHWRNYTAHRISTAVNKKYISMGVRRLQLTPRNIALLQKQTIAQLVKKIPVIYGTRRFITAFTRTRHWSLSWARLFQPTPSHSISLTPLLILSSHLRLALPSGLTLTSIHTKILYVICTSHINLHLDNLIISCEGYILWCSSVQNLLSIRHLSKIKIKIKKNLKMKIREL
jgi:hypothetical protein